MKTLLKLDGRTISNWQRIFSVMHFAYDWEEKTFMYDQMSTVIKTGCNSVYCSLTMRLWGRLYLEGMAKNPQVLKKGGTECEKNWAI